MFYRESTTRPKYIYLILIIVSQRIGFLQFGAGPPRVMDDMPYCLCALDDMPYSHGRHARFSWTICPFLNNSAYYFPILMQFSLLESIGQMSSISTLCLSLTGSRGEYLRVVGIHSDG